MEPIPEFLLRFHKTEDGKVLLILDVFKSEETPYYYSGNGTLEVNVRIGNESVKASATELKRLVLRGRNTSYDSQVSPYKVWRTMPFPSCGSATRSEPAAALTTKTLFRSGSPTRTAF